jgi:hypothetical protein
MISMSWDHNAPSTPRVVLELGRSSHAFPLYFGVVSAFVPMVNWPEVVLAASRSPVRIELLGFMVGKSYPTS